MFVMLIWPIPRELIWFIPIGAIVRSHSASDVIQSDMSNATSTKTWMGAYFARYTLWGISMSELFQPNGVCLIQSMEKLLYETSILQWIDNGYNNSG